MRREREKGKNYDPFQFMQNTSERVSEREKEFYFERKEKNFRQPRADLRCCCCAKRAPAPNSADLSDLNKKLLQYVSLCSQLQRCHTRFIYVDAHTNVLFKRANFPLLYFAAQWFKSLVLHVLMNVKRTLRKSSKISRETVGVNSFDLAMRLAQITSVKSLRIDVKWRRIEHGC